MRPTKRIVCRATAALVFALAGAAPAATVGTAEAWSAGTPSGWSCEDRVNECTAYGMTTTGGVLAASFKAQSMRLPPEEYMFKADTNASGGAFTGDYIAAGVATLSFRLYCEASMNLSVLLGCPAAARAWRCRLPPIAPHTWQTVSVPLSPDDLHAVGAVDDAAAFADDLRHVGWVAVCLERNDSPAAQHCAVDDVCLTGPGTGFSEWVARFGLPAERGLPLCDADGDGMSNWDEWLAATCPTNRADALALRLRHSPDATGDTPRAELSWSSKAGRRYRVWYTESLDRPFRERCGLGTEGTGGNLTVRDEQGGPTAFYRITAGRMSE